MEWLGKTALGHEKRADVPDGHCRVIRVVHACTTGAWRPHNCGSGECPGQSPHER
jgi:hypothetical protein